MSGIYHKNKEWANVTEINKSGATATEDASTITVNGKTYAVARTLSDLTDTIIADPSNGEVLEYDGSAHKWRNGAKKADNDVLNRSYQIANHTVIEIDTEDNPISLSTWVSRVASILKSIVTDHATWIESFPDLNGEKSVTGNPITFTDGSESYASQLDVELKPIQDLHGYDKPWVGGAGKNKLPMTVAGIKSANTDGTWSGNVYTINGGTFTILTDSDNNVIGIKVNGTFTASCYIRLASQESAVLQSNTSYILNQTPSDFTDGYLGLSTGGSSVYCYAGDGSKQFTVSTNTRLSVWLSVGARNYSNKTIYPMVRLSTVTDATFAPYTNICPITGYTEVNVDDVGINRWDGVWESGYYDASGNTVSSGSHFRSVNYTKVEPNMSYYFVTGTAGQGRYCYYDKNKQFISRSDLFNGNTASTIPSNCYYIRFHFDGSSPNNVGINYPSTATTYTPYNSSKATITFGQEVFGCDVDMLTGKVVVTEVAQTFDGSSDESWRLSSNTENNLYSISNMPITNGNNREILQGLFCDKWKTISADDGYNNYDYGISGWDTGNQIRLNIPNTIVNRNVSNFKTYLSQNPIQVVMPLATPITLQLSPAELKLLKDNNTITTNGYSISMKYQPTNVLGDVLESAEEYTNRHFGWKQVGIYANGDTITIDGYYNEIMLVPNHYSGTTLLACASPAIFPFSLFKSITLQNSTESERIDITPAGVVGVTGTYFSNVTVFVR